MTTNLSITDARNLAIKALVNSKVSDENAASVANALIAAEVSGQAGHGLSRVPSYAAQSRTGKVDGFAIAKAEIAKPGLLLVDAGFGFAYPAFDLVIETLPDMVRSQGIASAAIRRSHHFGQAGAHCEKLAQKGLCAFVYGNTPKAIAPWTGSKPRLGTNPIAFAAPMPDGAPLVIDLALSKVARGKILAANNLGKEIPEGWALDEEGNPTTDASRALIGTMIPIGEAKGAALALMVEVMSACLTASNLAFQASNFFDGDGPAPNVGQTVLALDPQAFSGGGFFEQMSTLEDAYREDGLRLPGTRRHKFRENAEESGIDVEEALLEKIEGLSKDTPNS